MMTENEVGYYEILDNYTIWRLETITDTPPFQPHQTPVRTFSFSSTPTSLRPEIQPSGQLPHEVPLHKKRNLARNLKAMIQDLQQKVDRIEAEDGDLITSIIPIHSKPSHDEQINLKQEHCMDARECQHFDELSMVMKQLEVLRRDKNHLEEQIVRLRLDKSSDQGTDSEKRVLKLETENKLLREQLKLAIEKIGQQNKEKCQDFSSKFAKSTLGSELGRNTSRELNTKLRKYHGHTMNLKEDLVLLKESFQSFHDWGLLQLHEGRSKLRQLYEQRRIGISTHQSFTRSLTNGNCAKPLKNESEDNNQHRGSIVRKISRLTNDEPGVRITNNLKNNPIVKESESNVRYDCSVIVNTINADIITPDKPVRGNGVLYRIRPLLEKGAKSSLKVSNDVIQVQHKNRNKVFHCERTVHPNHSQNQLFEMLKPAIMSCMDGTDVCIFLYGETGSGKTYTAEGNNDYEGILSSCVEEILKVMKNRDETLNLSCSVAELRNEVFRDILNCNSKANYLETKHNSDGSIMLSNWTQIPITRKTDYDQVVARCQAVHKVHNCNMSHVIHVFYLCLPNQSGRPILARLCIVDLAGSERMDKSSQDPIRLKEIQSVSKSLTCLGDVLHAINSRQCHVPYRTTKLTHFLQDFMQNNSRSELVVHLKMNETNSSETISSLLFGQRTIGGDLGQPGTKTPTKSWSRNESHTATPRPRRPSTGNNMSGFTDNRHFVRRSSVSSERSSRKMSITPQSEGQY